MNKSATNQAEYTKWQKAWPLLLFLLIGVFNVFAMKFSYVTESKGIEKYGYHQFQKPWFIIMIAFFGQSMAIFIYMILKSDKINKFSIYCKVTEVSYLKYCIFSIPAVADVLESVISAVTIAYLGPSIDSMLKSFTLIGTCLISRFYFKKHFMFYQIVGIILIIIGLVLVSLAGIINSSLSSTIKATPAIATIIIILKIISQFGYSVKISFEEYFTQIQYYHPLMVSGFEGTWCVIVCAFICLPVAQQMSGTEGNGIHEDTLDTFEMLKNSITLSIFMVVVFILGVGYSFISITFIKRTSAVIQTIWKAFRTFIIWLVQFIVFYSFRKNEILYPYRLAGEEWVHGSYIKLIGFIVLVFGIFCFNKIPKYPCLNYGEENRDLKELSDESCETTCENAKVAMSPLIDEEEVPSKNNKKEVKSTAESALEL